MAARGKRKSAAKSRRKKAPPRRPAPPRKKRQPAPRRPRKSRSKKSRDWRAKVNRKEIRDSLKRVAPSLVDHLRRSPLFAEEAVYLRGIAKLAGGKRLTNAQSLAVLAAMRYGSPLFRSMFGLREERLVEKHRRAQDTYSLKAAPWFSALTSKWADAGKAVFYKTRSGALQKWSWDGFRRFMMNPVYKLKRAEAFGGGRFYVAHPTARGDLPKKGRTRIPVM